MKPPTIPIADLTLGVAPALATSDLHDQGEGQAQRRDRAEQRLDDARHVGPGEDEAGSISGPAAAESLDESIAAARERAGIGR